MKKLLIFGGTSEEHALVRALAPLGLDITLCVASDYGRLMAPAGHNMRVETGRLDLLQIRELLRREGFVGVVDATHPYAVEATKNIRAAAFESGVSYFRLLRDKSVPKSAVIAATVQDAAEKLNGTSGNVLLTTGSKELAAFTAVRDFKNRLYPRVLPTAESLGACMRHGFLPNHIIAMHGPFSQELNIALMRQFDIKTLVTKDGGALGGFPEKVGAAEELGAGLIVIRRPEEDGLTLGEVVTGVAKLLEVTA
ncbi:precorrin-6A/cobalt-precorrin-6A reductase [Sporobacter termitidis DSM 10068]|uniref:Precorrin-6A/cobalt-precorrin-6A reductase n=1 Tax=Sporobacter termitidis DSM 10068 TaxID=1123282 RepID=A0A1M5XJM3_9FIRM|nr:precorrin-6A reductase [Sporobacter termitidis]SHI00010.1 precorrin-6A/cobalt-precorrin-6A reductase [Sporobacter termitidis DSM 10068]